MGIRQIVHGLNRDGIPAPSAYDRKRNPHRRGDGWQVSTVHSILGNIKYTGYMAVGRQMRVEVLVDPENVALGYKRKLVKSTKPPTRSKEPTHEALVSVEGFTKAMEIRHKRSDPNSDKPPTGAQEATGRKTKYVYPLQGRIRCSVCGRKLSPSRSPGKDHPTEPRRVRYRCRVRDLVPGSTAAEEHGEVAIDQRLVINLLTEWMEELASPDAVDETVKQILDSAAAPTVSSLADLRHRQDRDRLKEAQRGLANLVSAIERGADADALIPRTRELQEEINRLRVVLKGTTEAKRAAAVTEEDVRRVLARTAGDLDEVLTDEGADYKHLRAYFAAVDLQLVYDQAGQTLTAEATLGTEIPSATRDEGDVPCPRGDLNPHPLYGD
ncbi:MAG: recombinase family protein [Acidimicrobiaceae bacterium]|nr:recombinase family protein [Acidimicrobiaceae bacterium]